MKLGEEHEHLDVVGVAGGELGQPQVHPVHQPQAQQRAGLGDEAVAGRLPRVHPALDEAHDPDVVPARREVGDDTIEVVVEAGARGCSVGRHRDLRAAL
ncbi:MAG: hypothetical protein IPO67_04615 [Deltaproteobacteria bacterium]|nr:hypothetical protein [Deltaproteobacteria bacterium]